jgi:hypothetical protein
MNWTLLAILICFSLTGLTCSAAEIENSCAVESSLIIRSLGSNIGTVNAKIAGTSTDSDLQAAVDVHAGWWFLSFFLKSTETASIRGGKLVAYHKMIDTGGQHKEIVGKLKDGTFSISIRDKGKTIQKEFLPKNYHVTNLEYPEVTLTPGEVRKMRVIDLENAEVVDREYIHIAEEHMVISGKDTRVVVSDAVDKYAEYRRWTAVVNGVPVVIRQEGKEKTGLFNPAYYVRMKKVAVAS